MHRIDAFPGRFNLSLSDVENVCFDLVSDCHPGTSEPTLLVQGYHTMTRCDGPHPVCGLQRAVKSSHKWMVSSHCVMKAGLRQRGRFKVFDRPPVFTDKATYPLDLSLYCCILI